MSTENRQCPICEQLVGRDVLQIKVKGKVYHEGCAKAVTEAYMTYAFNSRTKSFSTPDKKCTTGVAKQ